jgi:soluble lytic murein transglycosylase
MLARALLARGDRDGATMLVRYAWRHEDCSGDVEKRVLDMFGGLLTREDHKLRMEQRFYSDDAEAGMREANRLGGDELAIGRARAAVIKHLHNAKALLDAVPVAARSDPGYIFSRAQWLRRDKKLEEASKLMLTVPQDAAALVDTNQWWLERRILVRKLLDDKDAHAAYRIARDAAPPTQANWRADQVFTAGWIALRFLHDPKTAAAHFARIAQGTVSPYALARGGYWQGRAADAMGDHALARTYYEKAAVYTTTYYGQLARARLGLADLGLRGPPSFTPEERNLLSKLEVVRAAEILYALDERDMLASVFAEIGESGTDIAGMAALGDLAAKHGDGRSMLLLGQYAHSRGLPLDYYAYPTVGLPNYKPVAPPIEASVAYSIARQESHFNQKIVSPAHAMGLMQVTPAAAQDTAAKFKVTYNRTRLLKDPVYNMQMGAAELSNLLTGYHGSYLLTFAGYNAGRGRVRQWIAAYGDPRDPRVDPVDWVEHIPIAETRNYVERIMENLQVYRARFGGGSKLLIDADLKRGAEN